MIQPKTNMANEKKFTLQDAQELISLFPCCKDDVDMNEFLMWLNVELEHWTRYEKLNVTNDDGQRTAKIALAHLMELPDYYTRLAKMEKEWEQAKEWAPAKPRFESEIKWPADAETFDAWDFLLKSTP